MPEPAIRSRTVLDTSTSPGPACAATLAPTCTARPASFSPSTSHSPVWTPARTTRPSSPTDDTTALAQRIARAGHVEGGEEAVSRRVDLATAEALELAADGGMVVLE